MKNLKWNYADSVLPVVGNQYLVANKGLITTAYWSGDVRGWETIHNRREVLDVIYWAELPKNPNTTHQTSHLPDDQDWISTNSVKRPSIGNLYLIANKLLVTTATFKGGKEWVSFFEDISLPNVTHYQPLPKNPNQVNSAEDLIRSEAEKLTRDSRINTTGPPNTPNVFNRLIPWKWNQASAPPLKVKSLDVFMVATDDIIVDASFNPNEEDKDKQWYSGAIDCYIQGVTHWHDMPQHPDKLKYNKDEFAKWHDANSMKKRPKPNELYLIAGMGGSKAGILRYKPGNNWETWDGEPRYNINYWRELPPNPNKKR